MADQADLPSRSSCSRGSWRDHTEHAVDPGPGGSPPACGIRASSRSATYAAPAPSPQPGHQGREQDRPRSGAGSPSRRGGSMTWAVTLPKSLTSWACLSWSTTELKRIRWRSRLLRRLDSAQLADLGFLGLGQVLLEPLLRSPPASPRSTSGSARSTSARRPPAPAQGSAGPSLRLRRSAGRSAPGPPGPSRASARGAWRCGRAPGLEVAGSAPSLNLTSRLAEGPSLTFRYHQLGLAALRIAWPPCSPANLSWRPGFNCCHIRPSSASRSLVRCRRGHGDASLARTADRLGPSQFLHP